MCVFSCFFFCGHLLGHQQVVEVPSDWVVREERAASKLGAVTPPYAVNRCAWSRAWGAFRSSQLCHGYVPTGFSVLGSVDCCLLLEVWAGSNNFNG